MHPLSKSYPTSFQRPTPSFRRRPESSSRKSPSPWHRHSADPSRQLPFHAQIPNEPRAQMPTFERQPCVYLLASKRNGTLYVGVTSDLVGRVWRHRNGQLGGFTDKYCVHRLVWYEPHHTMESTIRREKQIKSWHRSFCRLSEGRPKRRIRRGVLERMALFESPRRSQQSFRNALDSGLRRNDGAGGRSGQVSAGDQTPTRNLPPGRASKGDEPSRYVRGVSPRRLRCLGWVGSACRPRLGPRRRVAGGSPAVRRWPRLAGLR